MGYEIATDSNANTVQMAVSWRTEVQDGETVAVLIAPLLLESGLQRLCDTVVTVSAPYEMRLSRLLARDGIDASLAAAIMNSQLSDEERECRSDAVIRNDGDIKSLREQAKTLYNEICERIRIR